MPVVAAQPMPTEAAPQPWPAAEGNEVRVLVVPAQAVLLPLHPSKLAVYKLFTDQVT